MKRTKAEYIAAIRAARGLITVAAKNLGVSFSAVTDMAKRHPEIRQAIEESREQMLDFAEGKLFRNIDEGDNTAIIFFLKTQGKARGYVERVESHTKGSLELSGPNGGPMQHTSVDLGRLSLAELDQLAAIKAKLEAPVEAELVKDSA